MRGGLSIDCCDLGVKGGCAVAVVANRYPALMTFGASYFMGAQMGSVLAVLPFLLASEGVNWAATLVVPVFSVGFIVGNALSPAALQRSRRRHYVVIASAAAAIAVLTAFSAAAALRDRHIALAFLVSALVIGGAMGLANNAYAEIISRMLSPVRRNDLMLNQQAVGAVLTVLATLLVLPLLRDRHPGDGHVDVLWFGALAMAVAFAAALTVGPSS